MTWNSQDFQDLKIFKSLSSIDDFPPLIRVIWLDLPKKKKVYAVVNASILQNKLITHHIPNPSVSTVSAAIMALTANAAQ